MNRDNIYAAILGLIVGCVWTFIFLTGVVVFTRQGCRWDKTSLSLPGWFIETPAEDNPFWCPTNRPSP